MSNAENNTQAAESFRRGSFGDPEIDAFFDDMIDEANERFHLNKAKAAENMRTIEAQIQNATAAYWEANNKGHPLVFSELVREWWIDWAETVAWANSWKACVKGRRTSKNRTVGRPKTQRCKHNCGIKPWPTLWRGPRTATLRICRLVRLKMATPTTKEIMNWLGHRQQLSQIFDKPDEDLRLLLDDWVLYHCRHNPYFVGIGIGSDEQIEEFYSPAANTAFDCGDGGFITYNHGVIEAGFRPDFVRENGLPYLSDPRGRLAGWRTAAFVARHADYAALPAVEGDPDNEGDYEFDFAAVPADEGHPYSEFDRRLETVIEITEANGGVYPYKDEWDNDEWLFGPDHTSDPPTCIEEYAFYRNLENSVIVP